MPMLLAGGSAGDLIGAVLIFCGMMAAAWLILRFLQKRGQGFGRRSRTIETLDQLPLTREFSIMIVRAAGRILVIGSGRDGGSLLCELTEEQWNAAGGGRTRQPDKRTPSGESNGMSLRQRTKGFGTRFWYNLRIQLGLLPKDTAPMTPQAEPTARPTPATFAHALDNARQSGQAPAPSTVSRAKESPAPPPRRAEGIFSDEDMAKYRSAARPAAETSEDEETARELVDMLQSLRAERHQEAAPVKDTPPPGEGRQLDELLDQVTRRQQKYAARGRSRKDAP